MHTLLGLQTHAPLPTAPTPIMYCSEEGWQGAFAALGAVLRNRQVYCRVRIEAALMLGAGSSDLDSFEGKALAGE